MSGLRDETKASADTKSRFTCLSALAEVLSGIREKTVAGLGLVPGMSVLDAGCGVGELAISLAPRVIPGGRIVGIDLNAEAIERAHAAAANADVEVEFRVGDIRDLPLDDNAFDAVRSERVFQYLDLSEASRAAAELVRVARPGGVVQIVDPDHLQTAIAATDRELAWLLTQQFTLFSKNPESGLFLTGLLCATGAVDVRTELWPIVFTRLADFSSVRDLRSELAYLVARGVANADRTAAFMTDLEARDRNGTFLSTVITYAATGRKT